jgi:hypothetical protein
LSRAEDPPGIVEQDEDHPQAVQQADYSNTGDLQEMRRFILVFNTDRLSSARAQGNS